jgi:TonB family protein
VLASNEDRGALEAKQFSLASDIVELVVLTADELFLQTLRDAVGPTRRLWNVATPEKVSDLLLAGSVGILVLDAQASRDDAPQFIAQIKHQFPDLVIIVAGDRGCETALAPQISTGMIYRFIHKPMSPGRAKLFTEAAVRKYGEQRRQAAATPPAVRTAGLDRRLVAGGAVGGGALAIAAGLFLAHVFLHTDRAPDSSRHLLAANPADPTAGAGVAEVRERLLAHAENALLGERLDEAQAAIEAARAAGVESGRIAFLAAELGKSRDQRSVAQARALSPAPGSGGRAKARPLDASGRAPGAAAPGATTPSAAASAATPGKHVRDPAAAVRVADTRPLASRLLAERQSADSDARDQLLKSVHDRVAQDQLVEPTGDSAKDSLLRLREADPANPGLAAAIQDLGDHMVAKARQSAALEQWDAARKWLDEAAGIGYDSADATALRRDVDMGTANQALLDNVVAANSLVTIKTIEPRYPERALRNKIEGWVELDFTVAATGEVKDIAVHGASLPGVFDQAARQALAQWRYRPVIRDSKPVEQRARIRIRFTLA